MFATVGADRSLRMFDLRFLEHSTILYETPDNSSLLRLVWNKLDSNFIATFVVDSNRTIVVDIRMPSIACIELSGHSGDVIVLRGPLIHHIIYVQPLKINKH
mmetsp:Transcript_24957/g.22678  ORF Transcript_24957/g.22678 Transcript_24957/m.22678 type:complete len:102 (+) Transcript_24957:193-498(+)